MNKHLEKAEQLMDKGLLLAAVGELKLYRNGRIDEQDLPVPEDYKALLLALRLVRELGY